MSSSYRKLEYPCDCTGGDCGVTNAFIFWDYHTNCTFHLYHRFHGKLSKIIDTEIPGREALIKILTTDSDELSLLDEKDMEDLEKVRFGNE